MNKKLILTGIIFLVLGLGALALSFIPADEERAAEKASWNRLNDGAGVETEGVSISTQRDLVTEGVRYSRKINAYYCAVYEYAVGERTYRATAIGNDCKDNEEDVVMGETATILYDPADPSVGFVKSDATAAANDGGEPSKPWFLWIVGPLFILFSIFAFRAARPKTPEQIAKDEERMRKVQAEVARINAEAEAKKRK